MDSQEQVFDNVKFEKAKMMARYNRFRRTMKLFQFLEVLVALLLISWSSTRLPGALKISGRILFEVANYLFNPHVVFLIGNVIIVALCFLCRGTGAGSENSCDDDLYDEYARHSQAHAQQQKVAGSGGVKIPPPEIPATPETRDVIAGAGGGDGGEAEEKQIILWTEEKAEQCDAVTTAIETAAKRIEKFQRMQSEKLKREIAVEPQGELRRSETVQVGRGRTERPKATSFDTVDNMSDEDFNRMIDGIIKQRQKFLMEQKLAENGERRKTLGKVTDVQV
ncbi:uncharacterized protein LOC113749199 [Coffea eugenioides]|uniref:uncharacterized protein LOC113749199 n=1 Tax=Coffea eugenioides TaxID=49369 RepID=UPI000F60A404|nr:uncharacterized protein LOC113749199 [Coffea eugenioides]